MMYHSGVGSTFPGLRATAAAAAAAGDAGGSGSPRDNDYESLMHFAQHGMPSGCAIRHPVNLMSYHGTPYIIHYGVNQ